MAGHSFLVVISNRIDDMAYSILHYATFFGVCRFMEGVALPPGTIRHSAPIARSFFLASLNDQTAVHLTNFMPSSGAIGRPHARAPANARTDPAAVLIKRGAELLRRLRERDEYGIFLEPVPKTVLGYSSIITSPMDLGTCLTNLRAGRVATVDELHEDVSLIWSNAMLFNQPDTIYYKQAVRLRDMATRMFADLRRALDRERPVVGGLVRASVATTAAATDAPPDTLNISWKNSSLKTGNLQDPAAAESPVGRVAPEPIRGASAAAGSRARPRARRPPRPNQVKKGATAVHLQGRMVHSAATETTRPNSTDESPQVERAFVPPPSSLREEQSSTRAADGIKDHTTNTAPAECSKSSSLDGKLGPSDPVAVPIHPVDEKEMFVGPPPGASRESIQLLGTTKRPRRAVYDKLYANHVAASAPCARRLLAALLDPQVVRAYDYARQSKCHLETKATETRSAVLSEETSAIVGPACTTKRLLPNGVDAKFPRQPSDPQLPAEGLASDERPFAGSMNSVRDNMSLPSPKMPEGGAVKPERSTLIYDRSGATKGVRVQCPSEANCPEDGTVDSLPDSELITCPSSTTELASTGHMHETKHIKRVAVDDDRVVQPLKRVRFSVPLTQPLVRSDANEDTYNRLKELVGDSLALAVLQEGNLKTEICGSPTAESLNHVAELLKEHEIDSSFLEAYKEQALRLGDAGTPIEHVQAVADPAPADFCHVQDVLAKNHELLMNMRRLRANAECADSAQRLELLRLEKKYSSRLIDGIASVIGSVPPRVFARPMDVACAALTLAASTPNTGLTTYLPFQKVEAIPPSDSNATGISLPNANPSEGAREQEMSPD
jgi:hypothetical protein